MERSISHKVKKTQAKFLSHNSEAASPWDTAISDAEKMLTQAKDRVARLKRTITIFKEFRDSGESFPSEKSEQTEAGA